MMESHQQQSAALDDGSCPDRIWLALGSRACGILVSQDSWGVCVHNTAKQPAPILWDPPFRYRRNEGFLTYVLSEPS